MNMIEEVRKQLREWVESALLSTKIVTSKEEIPEIVLEVPKEAKHGDYSTNIAMQLAKQARTAPRKLAEKIVASLQQTAVLPEDQKTDVVAEHGTEAAVDAEAAEQREETRADNSLGIQLRQVEIAGPGFINFHLDKRYLHAVIGQVLTKGEDYGRVHRGQGQKLQVEFVSANPTGSLHLGHARGAAVGDALCNLLAFAGYEVSREYYINDAGNQINNLASSIEARYRQQLGQQVELPEDGYYGEDIIGFAEQLVAERGDELLRWDEEARFTFFRDYGLEQELAKIKRDLQRFGVHFDVWFSETSLYEQDKITPALALLKEKGQTYEEDGALWLRSTDHGDDKDRVLIKQDGSYTYLTPDIAYHQDKFSRGFDRLINIWGADHHGYIPRMKAAMIALGYRADQLDVLIAQMVSLFQNGEKVKMSKRTGKAVTMEELMDEVGVDAIRYFFTMRSMDSHLDFDMDLAISQSNENPVYYVQYAHARICSVLRQAAEQGMTIPPLSEVDVSVLDQEAEFELLAKLAELPGEVELAAEQYAPHRMIRYVYELASRFHSYYRAERVLVDDQAVMGARLSLFLAVQQVLQNVLKLVGVSAPERM